MGGAVLSYIFLKPILDHFFSHLTSREDGIFIAWTINWVSTALLTGQNFFNAPIFYPLTNTLAFSDPFLTSGLANIPLTFFTDNLVIQNNVQLILGTLLTFIGMYLLSFFLSKRVVPALGGTIFFTFSSLHLHYLVHLHTYLIAGLPFTLFFYLKWVKSPHHHWLYLSILAFLAQTLNSPMTSFFTLAVLIPFLLTSESLKKIIRDKRLFFSMGLVILLIIGLFYAPYFVVSQQFYYTRSIRDAANFAHAVDRFFTIELLIVYGLILSNWRKIKPKKVYVWITIIGAVLMLGPVLKLGGATVKILGLPIPLPYTLFYYLVPGFRAFRASSRWIMVFNFGLSLLLAKSLSVTKWRPSIRWGTLAGFTLFLWLSQIPQLQLYAIPQTPPLIHEVIKNRSEPAVAEFPIYIWSMNPYVTHEGDRLLYQAFHGKRLYNGASGFTPPDRESTWLTMSQEFPGDQTLDLLKQSQLELLVVHFREYQRLADDKFAPGGLTYPDAKLLELRIAQQPRLQLLTCIDDDCAYTISP